ncbi:hypothetical protein BJ165DRAFT_1594352 [Panaeolus papilionaceus]|nr:hypothetical protein BJ165DRAFT_1594352 [Panaeolus papilionaceus]
MSDWLNPLECLISRLGYERSPVKLRARNSSSAPLQAAQLRFGARSERTSGNTNLQWGEQYNLDIIHVGTAGRDFMVLNSYSAAVDLLDTRSAIYSSRVGWKWLMSAMSCGESWRERRRLFVKFLSQNNADFYRPRQTEYIRKTLVNLLDRPDDFLDIICGLLTKTIGGIAISLACGLPNKSSNDPYVERARKLTILPSKAGALGGFLVDFSPRASFQNEARPLRKLQEELHNFPYAAALNYIVRQGIQSQSAYTYSIYWPGYWELRPSFVSDSLKVIDETGDARHQREATLWTVAVNVLAVFNINEALGVNGRPIQPVAKYQESRMVRHPSPFKYTIKPVSNEAEALIHACVDNDF